MTGGGNIVSIFGSSRSDTESPDYRQAYEVGREVAECGFVVCNGGYGGTMEASAKGAKETAKSTVPSGARTIGVIVNSFGGRSANRWIDTVITVDTMVDRLLKLISLGDAYVVLKGGTGTLLEFAAVWEFMNKRLMHEKPIIVVGQFWNGTITTLRDELAWEGLEHCTSYVTVVSSPVECGRILRSLHTKE